MSGWIKCSDRLPDIPDPAHPDCSENVLIFVDGFIQFGFIGLDDDPNWYLGDGSLIEEAIVSHWQPLPSPPTE